MNGRAPTAHRRPKLSHLQNTLYRIHGIRVIFKLPHNTALPARGCQVLEDDYFVDDRYVSEFYHYLELVAPEIPYDIVCKDGNLNPHGNSKVKNIRFHKGTGK